MTGPEKLFEGSIKRYLHSVGIYPANYPKEKMETAVKGWYVKIWGGGFQRAGIPDILACVNGRFVAIEVKAENGKKSSLQTMNLTRIRENGGIALYLYPHSFEAFKEELNEIL